jgi:L-alanine-DL-glutamate epimerase-like enolase superfamily enzyme
MLEMFARCEGVPVERVLDLPTTTGAFTYSAIVSDSEAEQFRRTVAQYRAMGFVDFKLKLADDLNHNHEKIKSMRTEHEQTPLRIRVDANNLWADVDTAVRDLRELAWDFVGIEEPLSPNAFDGMREVSECTGSPIILDESFLRVDQVAALARDAERWIINVRVSKMGGLFRSLAVVQAAGQAGIPVIVGAQVGETSVLTRAALVVARAAGTNLVAQEGAFGTHLLQTDVANPVLMFGAGGILKADDYALATASGWGLTLRPTQDFAVSLSE